MRRLAESRRASQRALFLALTVTASVLVAEVVGGVLTHSLALLADASHMLTDVGALGLGIFAIWVATRPATATRTYGFHRVEVLAALANGLLLIFVALYIFWEAAHRFQDPPDVRSAPMLGVAILGLLANGACGLILHRHSAASLNVRGAYLHVLSDALGSLGAVSAGIVMLATGWFLADPMISVLIGALILVSSARLLSESVHVLLEAVPPHIDTHEIASALTGAPGVKGVHDLHVWTVTSGFVALSCHCELEGDSDIDSILSGLCALLHRRFDIQHVTIQPEMRPLRRVAGRPLPCCVSRVEEDGILVDRSQGPC